MLKMLVVINRGSLPFEKQQAAPDDTRMIFDV